MTRPVRAVILARALSVDAFLSGSKPRRGRLAGVLAAVTALLAQPALVLAAAGGHSEHHAPGIGDLLFPAINFSIYLAIVIIYLVPAIRQYLQRRHEQIVAFATEAKSARDEAERQVVEARVRLDNIDTECLALRDDLVRAATQRGERTRAEAQTTGERRLQDAGVLAEQERRRARGKVRAEVAALATRLAEERIRKGLGPDDQRGFVERFLDEAVTQ